MGLSPQVIMSDRIWGSLFVLLGILTLVCFRHILARLTEAPKKVSGPAWYTRSWNDWVDLYNASRLWRVSDKVFKFIWLGGLAAVCIGFGLRTLLLMNEPPIRDSIWLPH